VEGIGMVKVGDKVLVLLEKRVRIVTKVGAIPNSRPSTPLYYFDGHNDIPYLRNEFWTKRELDLMFE
jgi:hypothetical protein